MSEHGETRPDVIARLEVLDDVIFAALEGDTESLRALPPLWNSAVQELGADSLEESRGQYLRHAHEVWEGLREQPEVAQQRVAAAVEIIGLLAG